MSENLIGATTAVFPIRLSVAVASPVDVEWATRDGSAVAGSDYKATAGTVTFLPGETEKQIEVQVYGQAITPSDDKVFFIRLNPPSNAVLVDAVLTCTINIIDDQGIPSVAVVVAEGRRGPKGDPGLSAYEQAVLMGYTGTLTEWMDQIADASKAADRAGDHAVSASEDALKAQEDALKAQNAAKNAVFAGVVFPTAAEGVDPVLGVQNGAYFNVRSPLSEHYIDEYQNVNGVAVATGKSYPTSDYVQDISEYIALPFVLETVYKLNQRVVLTNGYIVKSTVDGNENDPNVDMTEWVYSSLTPSHNLSDVDDKAEARTNLDVYSKDEVDAKGIYPVGSIRWWNGKASMIPDGCVPLSGTLLNRASYPDLWADIQAGVYDVIEDTVWLSNPDRRWAFSVGDGSTTFRLPDYNGIQSGSIKSPVLRGSGYSNPSIKSDAIRNITGSVNAIRMGIGWTPQSTGALLGKSASASGDANNGSAATMTIDIDASRVVPTADENRPNSLFGIWIIQARGTTRQAPAQGSSATLLSNTFDGNQKINGDLEVTGTLNANIKPLLNAQGDAPISACRGRLVVNTKTSTILNSMNIQSFTKEGTGRFKITFINPMPHSNYAAFTNTITAIGAAPTANTVVCSFDAQKTNTVNDCYFWVWSTSNSALIDVDLLNIGVFC